MSGLFSLLLFYVVIVFLLKHDLLVKYNDYRQEYTTVTGVCTGKRDRTLSKSNYVTDDLGTKERKKIIINDYRLEFKK